MSVDRPSGPSALDGLRYYLDRAAPRCPECGHVDTGRGWQAETSGGRVRYRHVCPSCGATDERVIRIG
jgi:ribosomal protein L32